MLRKIIYVATFCALLGILQPSLASAAKLSGAGFGIMQPTVQGTNYKTFSTKKQIGYQLDGWAEADEILSSALALHISGAYQPYKIEGYGAADLDQWSGFLGVETRTDANTFPVRPFFGLEVGGVYSRLNYSSTITSPFANASLNFALRARTGFSVPVWKQLSANIAAPFTYVFSNNKFIFFDAHFGLRWSL